MRQAQVFTILVCLCGWITAENAYFSGRSSDLVLKPFEQTDDSFVAFLNRYNSGNSLQSIEETTLADYISYSLGGPLINPNSYEDSAFKKALPQGNVFDKDVANLMVVFDSLGSDLVDTNDLKMFQLKTNTDKTASINNLLRNNYPSDTITTLASMFSGYSSSFHGIVSQKWYPSKGVEVEAFKSVEGLPSIENVGDIYSINYEGNNLVFAISGDFQYVSALSVNQFVQGERSDWKNYGFYYDEVNSRMESIYGSEDIRLINMLKNAEEISQNLISKPLSLPSNTDTITYGDSIITVTLNSKNIIAEFDITIPEVSKFLVEIEMVRSLVNELKSNSDLQISIQDSIPDLFSVAFSSIKGIQQHYGKDSSQLKACIYILDELVASTINEISAMYRGKLSVELVFLGTSGVDQIQSNEVIKTSFFDKYLKFFLNHGVNKDEYENTYPYVYLTIKENEDRKEICSRFESSQTYSVICNTEEVTMITYVDVFERQINNGTVNTVDAPIYQLSLWTAVLLIVITYATVQALYNMDIGADSMIYRLTNIKHAHLN